MTQKFIHAVAHCIDSIKFVETKYGPKAVAEIRLIDRPKQTFWVSVKQGEKIESCFDFLKQGSGYSSKTSEVHLVLEQSERGLRFVWAGIHSSKKSELTYLEEKFGIVAESPYIGRPDLERDENQPVEADASLVEDE